jgi:sugar phosphate permease
LAGPGASLKGESAADRKVGHEGLTVRQALRTRPFWLLTFAVALAWLGGMALIGHLIAFLEESADFSRGAASAVAMGIPFASLVGRLGFGWLADYVVKRRLLAVAYIFQGAGILIFATTDSPWQAVLFLVVFSVGWGGAIPVLPALEAEYFGLRAFGGIQGLLSGLARLRRNGQLSPRLPPDDFHYDGRCAGDPDDGQGARLGKGGGQRAQGLEARASTE